MRPRSRIAILVILPIFVAGCDARRAELPVEFEPNLVHTTKYQIREEIPMSQMTRAAQDAAWVVGQMFGTPDEPKLPEVLQDDEDVASLVSIELLERASGSADAEGRGLFRKHCQICHGVTGNGRGPTAANQSPYPRDYRLGIFKFKSVQIAQQLSLADENRIAAIERTEMLQHKSG